MNFLKPMPGTSDKDILAGIDEAERKKSPEEKERLAEAEGKRRRAFAGANILTPCTHAQHEKLKLTIYGTHMVKFELEIEKLRWSGHEDELERRILEAMSHDPTFCKSILSVRPQVDAYIKRCAEKAALVRKEEVDSQTLIKKEADFLQKEQQDRRRDQVIQRESKNKGTRIFSDEEQAKLIHCQSFSQEDLERSRSNLVEKKTDLLRKTKDCDKTISKLELEKTPFDDKANELREKLENDD